MKILRAAIAIALAYAAGAALIYGASHFAPRCGDQESMTVGHMLVAGCQ
jgi:hypothetical protein